MIYILLRLVIDSKLLNQKVLKLHFFWVQLSTIFLHFYGYVGLTLSMQTAFFFFFPAYVIPIFRESVIISISANHLMSLNLLFSIVVTGIIPAHFIMLSFFTFFAFGNMSQKALHRHHMLAVKWAQYIFYFSQVSYIHNLIICLLYQAWLLGFRQRWRLIILFLYLLFFWQTSIISPISSNIWLSLTINKVFILSRPNSFSSQALKIKAIVLLTLAFLWIKNWFFLIYIVFCISVSLPLTGSIYFFIGREIFIVILVLPFLFPWWIKISILIRIMLIVWLMVLRTWWLLPIWKIRWLQILGLCKSLKLRILLRELCIWLMVSIAFFGTWIHIIPLLLKSIVLRLFLSLLPLLFSGSLPLLFLKLAIHFFSLFVKSQYIGFLYKNVHSSQIFFHF